MVTKTALPKLFIAVMGVTGSGKSTFINVASQLDTVKVGHELHSCTSEVAPFRFKYGGYDITLIDTPGFDDTLRSETEVLKEIADWLDTTYRNDVKLTGIIYMHAITDRRVGGAGTRNLKMFRNLCGEQPLGNVVLVTSGWDKEEEQRALEREEELKESDDYWAPMIAHGSTVDRFTDRDSALEIIMGLAERRPVVLQIQEELVDQEKNLIDTAAGRAVDEEIRRIKDDHAMKVEKLQEDMEEAIREHDLEMQSIVAASTATLERQLDKLQQEHDLLRYERRKEVRKLRTEVDDTRDALRREIEDERRKTRAEREQERRKHEMELQAQRYESKMQFDQVVAQIKAHEGRIRAEERQYLEAEILRIQQQTDSKRKGEGKVTKLLMSLGGVLSSVTMSALGFPMFIGSDPFSGIFDLFDN